MKKSGLLLMAVLLLCGCQSASKEEANQIEKGAQLRVQVEDAAYAKELKKLWDITYPKQKDALKIEAQPYFFTQQIDHDIIWTTDIDAPYLKDKLQTMTDVDMEYEVPKTLEREELEQQFFPMIGEGLVFCYRADRLEEQGISIEDLESFESMKNANLSYYHNHLGEYIYPFFADQLPTQSIPFQDLFPKQSMIERLDSYKTLSTIMDFSDDLQNQRDFYEYEAYDCGLLSTKFKYEERSSYTQGNLHFTTMPVWQTRKLAPPLTTFGFAVNKDCPYPKMAKQFLELTRSKEGIQAMLDAKLKVPLIETEDIEGLQIYDHEQKELMEAITHNQLYNLSLLKENPGITMEAVMNQSDFASLVQNYVCSDISAKSAYTKVMDNLKNWSIGYSY